MNVWVIQDGEPIPGIDKGAREWRSGILCKTLVASGHEVFWWASTFDHANKRFRFTGPRSLLLDTGLRLRLLHGPGYLRNKSPLRFRHQRVLARHFFFEADRITRPDVIYVSLPTLEFVQKSIAYGQKNAVPVIVDVRDLWPDLYLTMVPISFRPFFRVLLRHEYSKAKKSLKLASGIVAVSEIYLRWAIGLAQRPQNSCDAVFPLGYKSPDIVKNEVKARKDSLMKGLGIKPEKCNVCFVGSFGASYDLETVVEAAKILHKHADGEKIQIILAGAGDQEAALRRRADGLPNIVFTGWLDQVSISTVLAYSSAGLVAYKENALQSLPNKPFEYMAAGLPILSSLHGELEDLIKDEAIGLQYQAGDVGSLAIQLVWLSEHPEERKEMGKRSRKLFEERYDADLIYPSLVKHIEFVAAESLGRHPSEFGEKR